ncbi:IS3 family transposase [Streptomyces sp900116325]|uniref:IS3 family transposase n=1 Tax=Streptomyces sp. 900116325 TaxID=3154295 RepID=UPI0033B2A451
MLIKTAGLLGGTFTTRAEANLVLFEYIDGFYNSRRIQESSAGSVPSSSKRSTTPSRQRPNERT